MSSSVNNKRLNVSSITFEDGSVLNSARIFNNETHFAKKVKVNDDSLFNKDVTIKGSLTIEGDTNIVVENTVTQAELESAIAASESKDSSRYLIAHDANTYNRWDSNEKYTHGCTSLAANTDFIIREGDLKIQKGTSGSSQNVGKFLKCNDMDGTTVWSDIGDVTATIESITTNNGPASSTNDYSFKVSDTGVNGTATERGFYFYPNILSDYINNAGTAWQQQSIVFALGTGTKNYSNSIEAGDNRPRMFVCPFSKGAEALSFVPAFSYDTESGMTRLSGGTTQEIDQFITLDKSGLKIKPKNQTINNNYVMTSTSTDGLCKWNNELTLINISSNVVNTPLIKIEKIENKFLNTEYIQFINGGGLKIKLNNDLNVSAGHILALDTNLNCKWVPQNTYILPDNLVLDSIESTDGNITNFESNNSTINTLSTTNHNTNNINIQNAFLVKEGPVTMGYTHQYHQFILNRNNFDYFTGSGWSPLESPYHFIEGVEYRNSVDNYQSIGYLTIPANSFANGNLNIPINMQHYYNFKDKTSDSGDNDNLYYKRYRHWAYLSNIKYKISNENGTYYEGYVDKIDTIGIFVDRDFNSGDGQKMWDNDYKITEDFFYNKLKLNIEIFNNTNEPVNYTISVKFDFNYVFMGPTIRAYNSIDSFENVWQVEFCVATQPSDTYLYYHGSTTNPRPWRYKCQGPSSPSSYTDYTSQVYKCFVELRWDSELFEAKNDGTTFGTTIQPTFSTSSVSEQTRGPFSLFHSLHNRYNTLDNVIANKILVKNSLYCHSGYIGGCGYYCRPGVPSNDFSGNPIENLNTYNTISTANWMDSDIYNINWDDSYDQNYIDIWINNTIVCRLTPNYSDYRIKTNIKPIENLSDRINSVNLIKYDRIKINDMKEVKNNIGLLAHELQEIYPDIPNLVYGTKDGNNYQMINYNELTILLMKCIQELKQEIELLKN